MNEVHLVWSDWTVQGEGQYAGHRALFVRFPFCNLACPFCDTEFNTYTKWSKEAFIELALKETARLAVLTGGEPTMHKHMPAVFGWLKDLGFRISCESNGTFAPPVAFDWLTVSPKRFQDVPYYVHPEAFAQAKEFKYVVDSEFDFSILDRHDTQDGRRYSLSPEWGVRSDALTKILEYQAKHPDWIISLQTHKILGVK